MVYHGELCPQPKSLLMSLNSLQNNDVLARCDWCGDDALYQHYHDTDWGVPSYDDATLFEYLILEGAQAGLSWITILRRRESYRRAFEGFDPARVAAYRDSDVPRLLADSGIIRNRQKIRSAINNAKLFLVMQEEFGSFSNYLWGYVDGEPIVNYFVEHAAVPATTPLSDQISRDMKQRGFSFFGSTICYAYLQSMGVVNDHLTSCHRHPDNCN